MTAPQRVVRTVLPPAPNHATRVLSIIPVHESLGPRYAFRSLSFPDVFGEKPRRTAAAWSFWGSDAFLITHRRTRGLARIILMDRTRKGCCSSRGTSRDHLRTAKAPEGHRLSVGK
ncbi:UNVERIFIED_CONTAM: hypothetical protein PYX00_010073 [Menopon gallinae]|uniref:Uncharacterized protein n=1 Tax=Menopon gallinae TaxID=328185 RepID=A0AAW2HEH5_9NEOP